MDRLAEAIHEECNRRKNSPYELGSMVSQSAATTANRWAKAETLPSITMLANMAKVLGWDSHKVWYIMTGEKS